MKTYRYSKEESYLVVLDYGNIHPARFAEYIWCMFDTIYIIALQSTA